MQRTHTKTRKQLADRMPQMKEHIQATQKHSTHYGRNCASYSKVNAAMKLTFQQTDLPAMNYLSLTQPHFQLPALLILQRFSNSPQLIPARATRLLTQILCTHALRLQVLHFVSCPRRVTIISLRICFDNSHVRLQSFGDHDVCQASWKLPNALRT